MIGAIPRCERLSKGFWGEPPVTADEPGTSWARGIETGPDEALDRMRWTFMGASFERGEAFGAHLDTLLRARSADDRGAEHGRVARRAYRRADARKRRPSHGAMGRARPLLAGAGARLCASSNGLARSTTAS